MRGRRTTLVTVPAGVLVGGLFGGCDFGAESHEEPAPGPTLNAVDPFGGVPPELATELEVELGTAVAVFGRGCRPKSPHHRCSPDGTKTYTLRGRLREATVTAVWMQLDAGGGEWSVRVRFVAGDGTTAARAAAAAASAGGLVVVLDARTGEVLHALAPGDIDGGRISLHGLRKQGAEQVVDGYVTAATGH